MEGTVKGKQKFIVKNIIQKQCIARIQMDRQIDIQRKTDRQTDGQRNNDFFVKIKKKRKKERKEKEQRKRKIQKTFVVILMSCSIERIIYHFINHRRDRNDTFVNHNTQEKSNLCE